MIDIFLLVPENFEVLAKKTDNTVEFFESLYNYDQQWNVVSKIYLIEKRDDAT